MSRRTKIIVVVLLLAFAVLGLWYFLSRHRAAPPSSTNAPATSVNAPKGVLLNTGTTTIVTPPTNTAPPSVLVAPKPAAEANLSRLASAFAERYGSYSNVGNDFANLRDLEIFMSEAMKARTDAYIVSQRDKPPAKDHYGVTTRAINTKTVSYSDTAGAAEITVKTQRQEFIGNTPSGTVKYQDIGIMFVKQDGVWKADSAKWK